MTNAGKSANAIDISAPVILLLGDELLLRKRAEQDVIDRALPSGRNGFNHASFSCEDGGDAAMQCVRNVPMMTRRRVVVLRALERANNDLLGQLIDYVSHPADTALLLLIGSKLPPASGGTNMGVRLRNAIKKVGVIETCSSKNVRPEQFIQQYLQQLNCTMNRDAVHHLLTLVGGDLGRLSNELDKLVNFVGGAGKRITADAVEQVCSVVAEAVIWDLTDALLRRDADLALATTHRLLEEGQASHRLLSTVTWQMRQLLELQDAMRSGNGLPKSWARSPSRKVRAAQNLLREQPIEAHHILPALSRANQSFNRSRAGERRILEGLIMELTAS